MVSLFDSEYSSSEFMRMREPKLWSITLSSISRKIRSDIRQNGKSERLGETFSSGFQYTLSRTLLMRTI